MATDDEQTEEMPPGWEYWNRYGRTEWLMARFFDAVPPATNPEGVSSARRLVEWAYRCGYQQGVSDGD